MSASTSAPARAALPAEEEAVVGPPPGPVAAAVSTVLGAVTPIGWIAVAVVVVAVVVARLAGWVEAGVIAVAGIVCLLVAVGSVIGRTWARVEIALDARRTRVGEPVAGEVRASNQHARPVRSGLVELPIGAENAARFLVPGLGAGQVWTHRFHVPARRRGVVVIGPARSVRGDALGLLLTERHWARPERLLVHPRTVRVPFDAVGFHADAEGVTTSRLSSSDVSFHALRDYVPGDDRRHVHWPTTAKLGRLIVRQFEETRRSHHLILLDTEATAWTADAFEVGVSTAASLTRASLDRGRPVSFATSTGWVPTTSRVRLLDGLAELTLDEDAPTLTDRLRRTLASCRDISVLTVVCSESATDADASRWANLAGADVDTGVVRIQPGSPGARRTVGRAVVALVPDLDSLPRLVRRGSGR